MADQSAPRSLIDTWLSRGKDLVALLRDGALILLALLLIAFPSSLNDILVRAGFEEGSIVGFKWKARLVESDEALKTAQETISSLQEQLKKTTEALAQATATSGDADLKSRAVAISKESEQVSSASVAAQATVTATIQSNAPLVERAQATTTSLSTWGVVFGSDKTIPEARDEIRRARANGLPEGTIYFRNGYYASIIITESRNTAAEYLAITRAFRGDSYIARIESWCRNPKSREGYIECANTK